MSRWDREKQIRGEAAAAGRHRPPRYNLRNICQKCGCSPHADNCPTLRANQAKIRQARKNEKAAKKADRKARRAARKAKRLEKKRKKQGW